MSTSVNSLTIRVAPTTTTAAGAAAAHGDGANGHGAKPAPAPAPVPPSTQAAASASAAQRAPAAATPARPVLSPLMDIREEPEGLLLEADIPGASDDSVAVDVQDNVLTLHARVQWPVPEGTRVLYAESRVGDYSRSFILSAEVDRSQITAELHNGVLRLWLPRADRVKTRRIEVKSV